MKHKITIQWRQDHEFIRADGGGNQLSKLDKPIWRKFDVSDILHMPRNHALMLFKTSTPVVIKEGEEYITNSDEIYSQYRKNRKVVHMLDKIQPSEMKLEYCGFLAHVMA